MGAEWNRAESTKVGYYRSSTAIDHRTIPLLKNDALPRDSMPHLNVEGRFTLGTYGYTPH